MPDWSAAVEIPNRALFKASEVCELLQMQPYVLRSWEAEFSNLGVAKSPGGPRVYRREDVEQVQRIRHLLLVDGLTIAGVRRRLEEESAPVVTEESAVGALIGEHARERLTEVKRGLRSILDLLGQPSDDGPGGPPSRVEDDSRPEARVRSISSGRAASRDGQPGSPRRPVPARRKRSA